MNRTPDFLSELNELLHAMLDRTLDPLQQARLNEMLRSSAEGRRVYREYLALHAVMVWQELEHATTVSLQNQHGTPGAGVSDPAPVPDDRLPAANTSARPAAQGAISPLVSFVGGTQAFLSRPLVWSTLFVAAVFYGAFGLLAVGLRPSRSLPTVSHADGKADPRAAIADVPVARISADAEARWPTDTLRRSPDVPVRSGESLKIESGVVELKLKQGATLLVEGPAEWSIDGDNRATLNTGKLVAKVPPQAVGFVLDTPTAHIIDLGTEFGVAATSDKVSEVQVFVGRLEIHPAATADDSVSPSSAPIRLQANDAVRFVRDERSVLRYEKIADDKNHFVRSMPPSGSTNFGNRYAECVRTLKPLVYFRMESIAEGWLQDDVSGQPFGKIEFKDGLRDVSAKGPFGAALRFDGSATSDRVIVKPFRGPESIGSPSFSHGKEPGQPFSIALWVSSNKPLTDEGALVSKGFGRFEQFALAVNSDRRFRFFGRGANGDVIFHHFSKTLCDGGWRHVTAVFDPDEHVSKLFVNGQEESVVPLSVTSLFATDEPIQIGNRAWVETAVQNFPFFGDLDEVAIFPRALSASEIDALYRLLLQPTKPSS